MKTLTRFLAAGMLFASAAAHAQVVTINVTGNRAVAAIDSPLLALPVDAEFSLEFENPANLTASNLGLTVQAINLTDPALLARLPSGGLVNLANALPLLIRVEPPALGGLQFSNTVRVEVHTHLLPYSATSPLRLYKAPLGGRFYDITEEIASGSVRTRGRTGDFSEFLVLVDLRPVADAAAMKYDFLAERLAGATMSSTVKAALQYELTQSRTAFAANNKPEAIAALDRFVAAINANAGTGIPNRWRSARDLDNAAGDLLGEAASLRFTLTRP